MAITFVFTEDIPRSLAGLLSQYLIQVDHSLFVSRTTKKVEDFIVKKISENIDDGRAILITSANCLAGISSREIREKMAFCLIVVN